MGVRWTEHALAGAEKHEAFGLDVWLMMHSTACTGLSGIDVYV